MDVSSYDPVVWVERESEECITEFMQQCEERTERVCVDVTETFCEVSGRIVDCSGPAGDSRDSGGPAGRFRGNLWKSQSFAVCFAAIVADKLPVWTVQSNSSFNPHYW